MARNLVTLDETVSENISIELFWYGVRDWLAEKNDTDEKERKKDLLYEAYCDRYSYLREDVQSFQSVRYPYKFQDLRPHNYVGSKAHKSELISNLANTEIDVVLETPLHLLIGEAKFESDLDTDSNYVLVHQLIRQYVAIKLLMRILRRKKIIVPFILSKKDLSNSLQVKFMVSKEWMKEQHCLSWNVFDEI